MSGPLEDRLSQFTPAGFDRDGMLFAVGRASARPHRGWIGLAGMLALSQTLTLVLLWPRTPDPAVLPLPGPAAQPERPAPEPSEPSPSGPVVRPRLPESLDDWPLPEPVGQELVPDRVPLRAFSAGDARPAD